MPPSRTLLRLARDTYARWNANDGWLYAAAMAAFAALALAPLLVITLRVAEALGSERVVSHGLALVIDPFVGHGGVRSLNGVVGNAKGAPNDVLATASAVLIALFAGSRFFYALQRALHIIWRAPAEHRTSLPATIASFVFAGTLSVCAIGGLTVIIFGSAIFMALARHAGAHGILAFVGIRGGVAVVGGLILAPLLAALFRWLPGTNLTWGDVWIGAVATTVCFAIAQFVIGTYLASVNLPWTYGSAASVIVVLLWLYYSCYWFLIGAQFTHVYARERGSLRHRP